uniref:Nudix hydrolase domain-containing protein n=1 Tax=viral metagenome TaxID=1070528 RepID=A0A6C0EBU3_9ZZZZ
MSVKKKQSYCNNCDNYGHEYKSCPMPVTSHGIILVKLDKQTKIKHTSTDIKNESIGIYPRDYSDLDTISRYMNLIQFLMVRRKHSLGYIEFIRGRYKIDNIDGINFLFQQMVPEEINMIGSKSFDELWREMWNNDEEKIRHFKGEYEMSKAKFEKLKNGIDVDIPLSFYLNIIPTYKTQEWGFPKGRRSKSEPSLVCAQREFREETSIDPSKIRIISEIKPIEENLTGTNGVKYKHIYYVAELIDDVDIEIGENGEIGAISFFSYNDAINSIREYHLEKRQILTSLFMYYIKTIVANKIN